MKGAGRYAPSPSGPLHLGNLRTAMLAWLSARSQDFELRLRIDDLDPQRSKVEHETSQLADLSALGLDFDGPVLRQSERGDAYDTALTSLRAQGLLYRCWCTRAEIASASTAPHGPSAGRYPGTCRDLSADEIAAREATGRTPSLRVAIGNASVTVRDRYQGTVDVQLDDPVVCRTDGVHAYHLATVVDDAAQSVTEVVRGEDLLAASATQMWLIERLGLPQPEYAHVPLVLGPDGARLAKRDGAVTLAERRALGESTEQTLGLIAASLGLATPGESVTAQSLLERFDPDSFTPPPSGPL